MGETDKKRELFIDFVSQGDSAIQAYKKSYRCTEETAHANAYRLMANAGVAAEIAKRAEKAQKVADLTAEWILRRIKDVAERCLQSEPVMVFDRRERCMVQAVSEDGEPLYQFDSAGANRALELLGKHRKLFVDKVEVEASDELAKVLSQARERVKSKRKK